MSQRNMELQVAHAKEQAQADHRKELEAHDELIALLKEKVQQLEGITRSDGVEFGEWVHSKRS